MRMLKQSALLMLASSLVVVGCSSPATAPTEDDAPTDVQAPVGDVTAPQSPRQEPAPVTQVPFHALKNLDPFLTYSGLIKSERLVIQDAQTWATVWTQIVSRAIPQPNVVEVDFRRERVLLAAMGQKASGGYAISIVNVLRSGETLQVSVRETSPSDDCGTSDELTQPLAVVLIPAGSEPIQFLESTEVQQCL